MPRHRDLVGYARVSTQSQDAQLQRDALTTAGCGRTFEDQISGRNDWPARADRSR